MLSTQYRLRLEGICKRISLGETVELSDMIWANKLAKANTTANENFEEFGKQKRISRLFSKCSSNFFDKMGQNH